MCFNIIATQCIILGQWAGGQAEALLQRSDGLGRGHLLQRGAGMWAASVGESLSDGHLLRSGANTGTELPETAELVWANSSLIAQTD